MDGPDLIVYYYFILIVVGAEIRRGDPSALKVIISIQLPIHVIITTSMSMPLVHMERNWGKELSDHHYHYHLKPLIWFCVNHGLLENYDLYEKAKTTKKNF